ncbi:hypothetical protein ZIOFF_043589 [Zingiber officinale]|uniref:Uncharacterized protein n=1 Tax=Zingiber officinale TaxID=94328 RepID=A0A8J5KWG9_ZINOF|nr:hypothetical protein ZIOFF_043589 [Zingiber officinale]
MNAASIISQIVSIETLVGSNFKKWNEQIHFVLGVMDLDYALRVYKPTPLSNTSTQDEKSAYEKGEKSNRLSLMIMKGSISSDIRGGVPDSENAKDFLDSIEEQFQSSSKALATTLIIKMITSKYNDLGGVRGYILRMNDMAAQLKAMDIEISESFLVHFIMTSLPSQFRPFKICYNTQKEKWKMSELINMCDQEEENLKAETPDSAHFTTQRQGKKRKLHGKDKRHVKKNNDGNKAKISCSKTRKCNFCRELTHFQKDCPEFKEWLAKKVLHTTAYDNPKKYTQESISPRRAKEVKIESSMMSALNAVKFQQEVLAVKDL